jgi:hypothetical protein
MEIEFKAFLINAKQQTYAAQGDNASVAPLIAGSKQLEFRQDDWLYRDIYVGMSRFVGQEIVSRLGKPCWSTAYSGGIEPGSSVDVRAVYASLRQALLTPPYRLPVRGPSRLENGPFVYLNEWTGTIEHFRGREEIRRGDVLVYGLDYAGGETR